MKNELRKSKIQARNNLTPKERKDFSEQIVQQILSSDAFRKAKNIMIYKATKGEVNLESLETEAVKLGKKLYFPLCISKTEMIALAPKEALSSGETLWKSGSFGISEPVLEHSTKLPPEDLDMIICPCTVFDEYGGRIGMGAGYYDRYLFKCTKACVTAVAFEVQKTKQVPMEEWDVKMDIVFTEKTAYKVQK